jgi:hypothetical protein
VDFAAGGGGEITDDLAEWVLMLLSFAGIL